MINIPEQLRQPQFRFCLLKQKSKTPFEKNWQKKGYRFNDEKLLKHLEEGGNYGAIGGHGNLRVLDIDDPQLADQFQEINTFTVKTGRGGQHFYIISEYDKNHVLAGGKGELRSKNYQVVCPGSTHPNGKKYEIIKDRPITEIPAKKLKEILQPYLRPENTTETTPGTIKGIDTSRSGKEYREVCKLISKGMTKEAVFNEMIAFAKWSIAPPQYRELTYNKASAFIKKKHEEWEAEKETGKVLDNAEIRIEKKKTIEALRNEKEKTHTFLDLGIKQEIWYYGRKHNNNDSIITSDKRMLVNTLRKVKDEYFGENQIKKFLGDYDNILNDFAPMISKEAAIKWIENESESVSPSNVYKQVRDKILYYMDFSGQDEIADVLACWIMATYHYPLFYWFPNILFNCPRESGKTKCSEIVIQLAFKGYDIGASAGTTPAQLFRTIDMCRGTIRIDEYEQMDVESKKLCDQVLNAGVNRGAYVIRTEKIGNRFVPTKFPIYNPKVACNISGINATSLTRFIAFRWLKTLSEKANRQPTSTKDLESFRPIRDNLYLYGLGHFQGIQKSYENVLMPAELRGRSADNWRPLFALAAYVDSFEDVGAIAGLNKYVDNYKELDIDTGDCSQEFLEIIFEGASEQAQWYGCKELAGWELVRDLLVFSKNPTYWIGRKLTEYKFQKKRMAGGIFYLLSKEILKQRLDTYFTDTTTLTTLPTQTTQTTQTTWATQTTPKTPKEAQISPLSVVSVYDEGKSRVNAVEIESVEDTFNTNDTNDTTDTNDKKDTNDTTKNDISDIHDIRRKMEVEEKRTVEGQKVEYENVESVHHNCSICGKTPCQGWDRNQKPLCKECKEGMDAQTVE